MSLEKEKKELRSKLRERFQLVTPEEVVDGKLKIYDGLWHTLLFNNETRLLAYYPFNNEIDCRYFLRMWLSHQRPLYFPRVRDDGRGLDVYRVPDMKSFEEGYRGIMEPDRNKCDKANLHDIDAVFVPGFAFETSGGRLGQGGGHYDRFLKETRKDTLRIGLAWDWQVLDADHAFEKGLSIPREDHDELMDYLCTPSGLMDCNARKLTGR